MGFVTAAEYALEFPKRFMILQDLLFCIQCHLHTRCTLNSDDIEIDRFPQGNGCRNMHRSKMRGIIKGLNRCSSMRTSHVKLRKVNTYEIIPVSKWLFASLLRQHVFI